MVAVGTHMMSVATFFLGITISLAAEAPKINWGWAAAQRRYVMVHLSP